MLERDAAAGIHRVEDAHTNWYLVEEGSRLTVVDAGLPRSWNSLQGALRELGRSPSDIEAVVLTHAHFDHVGFARRPQQELGVPLRPGPAARPRELRRPGRPRSLRRLAHAPAPRRPVSRQRDASVETA